MSTSPSLPEFIAKRIYQLTGQRSQKEIAEIAGFTSPNIISMLKTGATKLPLDRVTQVAVALDCDPRTLMRMALGQFYEPSVVEEIFNCAQPKISDAELRVIKGLRDMDAAAK